MLYICSLDSKSYKISIEFKVPLMEVTLNGAKTRELKKKYQIKTLPLVIVYKDKEIQLREVPSLATGEKIYRVVSTCH